MLCRVVAVKSFPVHHRSAGYILFPLESLSPSFYFENRIPLKPALGSICSVANRLNQTESPIFVILCVLCFQRQSYLTFIVFVMYQYIMMSGKMLYLCNGLGVYILH